MNKDAYWFSHDSNAKDDPKCMLLIDQLGLEGYGIYWILIETLRDQPEYKYPLQLLPILAKRYLTSTEKMNAVVNNYGLFTIEGDKFFFSGSLSRRMLRMDDRRKKAIKAGISSGIARKKQRSGNTDEIRENERMLNGRSTNAEPVYKIRRDKIRKKDIKEEKIKEKILFFLNEENLHESFYEIIQEWLSYKKETGKPYTFKENGTSIGFTKFCNSLITLSNRDHEKAKQITEQSMANNWAGIFELKQSFKNNNQPSSAIRKKSNSDRYKNFERNGTNL